MLHSTIISSSLGDGVQSIHRILHIHHVKLIALNLKCAQALTIFEEIFKKKKKKEIQDSSSVCNLYNDWALSSNLLLTSAFLFFNTNSIQNQLLLIAFAK